MSDTKTKRLEALKELSVRVEGDVWHWETMPSACLPRGMAFDAYHGSLDEAKALHDVMLPDWDVWYETNIGISVKPTTEDIWLTPVKFTDNPARAWLLAIIKALIAEEEK